MPSLLKWLTTLFLLVLMAGGAHACQVTLDAGYQPGVELSELSGGNQPSGLPSASHCAHQYLAAHGKGMDWGIASMAAFKHRRLIPPHTTSPSPEPEPPRSAA